MAKYKTTPEQMTLSRIRQRCLNPRTPNWDDYGGRGIALHASWIPRTREAFDAFLACVGPKPGPEYSIDRINNNAGYFPGNIRWATRREQANNRRVRRDVCQHGTHSMYCEGCRCRPCKDAHNQHNKVYRHE